jgi:ABC-type oligopeptide transport system substrate-binding subunit
MLSIETLFMNTSRPLFANVKLFANVNLRKAVNYALDRRAIAHANEARRALPQTSFLSSTRRSRPHAHCPAISASTS